MQKFFITGTDTEVGKTFFTCALIHALQNNADKSVMAFKPVAAGAELIEGKLKNDDALAIIAALKQKVAYSTINPICLKQAIAPHIAANQEGVELSVNSIQQACKLARSNADVTLVEGAGGWLVPLHNNQTFADYVKAESLDVILVVGMKLGCINHALLTQQSIKQSGLNLVGWVANQIDPEMQSQAQNIETLKQQLNCPLIAQIPFCEGDKAAEKASSYVRIDALRHTGLK
jgi:dethiobiotin synthetase